MREFLTSVFGTPDEAQRAQGYPHKDRIVHIESMIAPDARQFDIPLLNSRIYWIHDELARLYGNGLVVNTDYVVQQVQERGIEVYDDMMDKDWHVFSCGNRLINGSSRVPFEILPADTTTEAKEDAKFIEDVFADCSIKKILKELYKSDLKGFRLLELVYKPFRWKGKDKLSIKEVIGVPERGVVFDGKWDPYIITKGNSIDGVQVKDPLKHLFMRRGDGAYGDPLLKHAYSAFWFKRAELKLCLRFIEKWVDPPLIGTFNGNISSDEVLTYLEQLKSESIAAFPQGVERPVAFQPDKVFDFVPLLQYWDDGISKVILSGTRQMSASDSAGAYSATQVHADAEDDYFTDLAEDGMAVLNSQLIPALIMINRGKREAYPTAIPGTKNAQSPTDVATRVATLFNAKVQIELSKRDLYEKLQLAPPDSPDDTIMPPAGGGPSPPLGFHAGESELTLMTSLTSPTTSRSDSRTSATISSEKLRTRLRGLQRSTPRTPKG